MSSPPPVVRRFRPPRRPVASCVPVYRQLTGDGLTPVSAFRRIERAAPSFLFESVIGGEKVGRFSFLGTEPFLRFEARGREVSDHRPGATPTRPAGSPSADPFRDLEALARALPGRRTCRACPGSPAARSATRPTTPSATPSTCPTPRPTTAACPTSRSPSTTGWSSSTTSARRSWSSPTPTSAPGVDPRAAYDQACARVDELVARLAAPGPELAPERHRHRRARSRSSPQSNFTRERVRGGRPPLPGVHQGRRHLPGRPQPAVPGRDARPSRSTSTASCGSSTRARSCSTCRSATSA